MAGVTVKLWSGTSLIREALAIHFNLLSDATWSMDDVNYDGKVDFDDLGIFAQQYEHTI